MQIRWRTGPGGWTRVAGVALYDPAYSSSMKFCISENVFQASARQNVRRHCDLHLTIISDCSSAYLIFSMLSDIKIFVFLSSYYGMTNFLTPNQHILESGPMPNVMAALPNIGGALCSTLQILADAQYWSAVQ